MKLIRKIVSLCEELGLNAIYVGEEFLKAVTDEWVPFLEVEDLMIMLKVI